MDCTCVEKFRVLRPYFSVYRVFGFMRTQSPGQPSATQFSSDDGSARSFHYTTVALWISREVLVLIGILYRTRSLARLPWKIQAKISSGVSI